MCSLEEAFGPITPNVPNMDLNAEYDDGNNGYNNNAGIRSYNTHGFDPMGPGQQAWNPSSYNPDMVGQPMTQTDNRRQYAQAANGLEHKRWQDNWSKPNPAAFTRGVHSNLSRENRMGSPRRHQVNTGAGVGANMQSEAYYPPRSLPGVPGQRDDRFPSSANYVPAYVNALNGDSAPGAPVSSVGDAPRAAVVKNRLKDTFGSVSHSRSQTPVQYNENTIAPIPNPSDYRNMHPTQWDNGVSGSPAQAPQFRSGMESSTANISELMMDAPVPTSTTDVRKLQEQIRQLSAKLEKLEKKVGKVESSRSHDIILIVVLAVFLLFIVDNVFGFNKLT